VTTEEKTGKVKWDILEIPTSDLDPKKFIDEKIMEISASVGDGLAVNALSGGVDSSAVTLLAYRALGDRLKTYFVEHGLMRPGEPERIGQIFKDLGVPIEFIDAKKQFFGALKGLTDPEEKREAITHSFYKVVFGDLVKKSGAKYLLQGTTLSSNRSSSYGRQVFAKLPKPSACRRRYTTGRRSLDLRLPPESLVRSSPSV
jgi:GMP synthase (glutamine-hydrolysing)